MNNGVKVYYIAMLGTPYKALLARDGMSQDDFNIYYSMVNIIKYNTKILYMDYATSDAYIKNLLMGKLDECR